MERGKMAQFDYDIGILGGGAAGLTVASGAAQLGARTLLIEKEKELGGDCLHFGCVPSKTLIKTAKVRHLMRNGSVYGLPEVEVPEVDFSAIRDRIRSVVAKIQKHDSVERFNRLGAEVDFGEPVFTDEHTINLGSRRISAKTWVVATGSSPAAPPLAGLENISYLTNKEIFYLDTLPKSLIVLGAGPIAVEMAQAFRRLGSRVSVLQRSDQILSKEDKDMAEIVQAAMEQEGVAFHLGCNLIRAAEKNGMKQVVFEDRHGREQTVEADEILVALGRQVNVEDLGLEAINLEYSRKGIRVDERLRTNHKHIFAAGDVIGGYQFTHAAGYEGGIVVSNAVFHMPRKTNYTWMPWCTYSSPELASIGMNEKMAVKAGVEYKTLEEEFGDNDRALAEGESKGKIKLILSTKDKVLGVQIAGLHSGDLIGEWVAALNGKVKLSTLAGSIHPYPTLTEINKRVVGKVFSEKIFSDRVKTALKLFFRYRGSSVKPTFNHDD